ncbi:radical SAM domain-containing protein [Paeniglutamicibacter antarcticus]|uniref:Radical SAM domain-containing protein n=1 Tax=Arthrobacter terrae TaxID=2935737 RepID=A0A931CLZ2_9MICC|nr:radical SAM domain-containing protein [Arthrobacter terrae]MBG0739382.1 radical SAM domain-containing protein [Arthrobacter terrae]
MKITALLRSLEMATRPIQPESRNALERRWAQLPEHAKTPGQLLGRAAVGCEGTHGVFPKCNLICSPCYHSADANKVRIDGDHTVKGVTEQMQYLRSVRGPRAHAQLIGGEVSLLHAGDHAAALLAMRANGREPMSMTHGDFDYQYLLDVVLGPDGRPRFDRVSFAAHFDSLMRGRRGAVRPHNEAELNPFRARFAEMFTTLKHDHGIRSYIAHNMTVTPANLDQVTDVTRAVLEMPYDMLSFQPAAYLGDDRRWSGGFEAVSIDAVWSRIEAGAGHAIPWQGTQFGDPRCNRTAVTVTAGTGSAALLDPQDPRDLAARDRVLAHFGGMIFGGIPAWIVATKILRALLSHPGDVPHLLAFAQRLARRVGGLRTVAAAAWKRRLSFRTFVVHNFMDAADVAPAWALMEQGVASEDPKIRETQERLGACMYTMSHPETGALVPACVQHSVLDAGENAGLRKMLPIRALTHPPAADADAHRPVSATGPMTLP